MKDEKVLEVAKGAFMKLQDNRPSLDDLLIFQGGPIKALGNGKIGGHLVLFGDERTLDLDSEFFNDTTDFDLFEGKTTAVYYQHGWDPILKRRRLGRGTLSQEDVGIWIEAQLEMRDEYDEAIYGLVKDSKLGWSSGTAPNLIATERKAKGALITSWPLGLDASLTPTPAEPRNHAIPLKSYNGVDLKSLLGDARVSEYTKAEADLDDEQRSRQKQVAAAALLLSGITKY